MKFLARSRIWLTSEGICVDFWWSPGLIATQIEISVINGSFEVRIEERNVNFVFVQHSAIIGMLVTLGWCITAFVTPLVRPCQHLIFLIHWDCTFFMLDSGIKSTDKTKWNEGITNLWTTPSLYSPWMGDVSKLFSFSRKELMNVLSRFVNFFVQSLSHPLFFYHMHSHFFFIPPISLHNTLLCTVHSNTCVVFALAKPKLSAWLSWVLWFVYCITLVHVCISLEWSWLSHLTTELSWWTKTRRLHLLHSQATGVE